MQKKISIKVLPSQAADPVTLRNIIAQATATEPEEITGYNIVRQSLDARGRQVWFHLTVEVFINEPFQPTELMPLKLREVHQSPHSVIVVGAGPAGLFAALRLISHGIKPIVLERGKDVRARRRDLAMINKVGEVNPESNYCFGEGGAGTYSDGKLYTRSTKRGDVKRVLSTLVHFGATDRILYEAHPHIGTNKLPQIITAIREAILSCGGEVRFEQKLTDFIIDRGRITGVKTPGEILKADAVILATGHSARDIFQLLHSRQIEIEFKPFALGVRVEHPQSLIDSIQYHLSPITFVPADRSNVRTVQADKHDNIPLTRGEFLPPASYSLVQQVQGKGVFSFCMCPGGIIAPAATDCGEIVVNGWSPSKRNNPYANSGIVVTADEQMAKDFRKQGPLAGLFLQRSVEQKAFVAGGGKLVAPAQRLVDFANGKISSDLPQCSYLPGIRSADLSGVLPEPVGYALREAFREFGKKMKGYFTNEAVVVATESRTSSPVRVPRNDQLHHPQIKNLYPCGEGAGYAGGIVSAAMDGERVADIIAEMI